MKIRDRLLLGIIMVSMLLVSCSRSTPAPQATAVDPTPLPQATSAVLIPGLLNPSGRDVQAKGFLDLLVQGDFAAAAAQFDPTMSAALPEQKLKDTWSQLLAQVGPLQEVLCARIEAVDAYERVTLTSQFEKAALDVRVVYDSAGQIAGLFFSPAANVSCVEWSPPVYVQPDSFEEVGVQVGSGEWQLPGTLSLPLGAGPFPAVVLVHGSGPNDRDESLGPNKPFRDLAWGLASQGIAVLRYDKRTLVHSQRLASVIDRFTVQEETVEDALLAVDLLRRTDKVDSERIYVLGHSLGGTLVPRIGMEDEGIAGFIILAGAARPLEDLILEQVTYLANLDGSLEMDEQQQLDAIQAQVEKIKAPGLTNETPPSELLNAPAAYWLDLRGYDPAQVARRLERPTFVLQGGRDYQVTEADYQLWQQALGEESWARFKLYPGLNHLFIPGEGRAVPDEYQQPGNVAEEVIQDIAGWVKE